MTRKIASVCFLPVLNTDHPVFNLIDNCFKKYLKFYYKSSLKCFGKVYRQLLRYYVVTLCNLQAVFFLDQTLQINGHFGYIWTELIEQRDQLWLGHIGVPSKEARQKVRHILYFISAFCVAPAGLKYATLCLLLCYHKITASDAFPRKAFL